MCAVKIFIFYKYCMPNQMEVLKTGVLDNYNHIMQEKNVVNVKKENLNSFLLTIFFFLKHF